MRTSIITILDRSGSMWGLINDTVGGYNDFIAKQREVAGEARATLVLFDHMYERLYSDLPLSDVPTLDRKQHDLARGNTALLDAVGQTLTECGQQIAAEKWAEKVIVVIVTDGQENASKTFTRARVKEMVEHAQKHGWEFLFLSADVNAFAEAGGIGIGAGNTASYKHTGAGAASSYGVAGQSILRARTQGALLSATLDGFKKAGGELDEDALRGLSGVQVPPGAIAQAQKPAPAAAQTQSTPGTPAA